MRIDSVTSRLTLSLIGAVTAVAVVAPATSEASTAGPLVAGPGQASRSTAAVPARVTLPSVPGKQLFVVATAPVGMAGPAAPAPVVVAVDKTPANLADLGRHEVKQGYVNEQQAAWQAAGQGALQGAGIGAIVGAIAGGIIGIFFPVPIVSIIPGAIAGAFTGAIWGAVGGAVNGYITGQNQARAHNNAVKANGGQPVAARVAPPAAAPVNRELREIPDVKLPAESLRAIEDAKHAFARALNIPIPR